MREELSMQGFLDLYFEKREDSNWMIVSVKVGDNEPEFIVNFKTNFEDKMDYYSKNYNDSLHMKKNANIKIVGFDFHKELHFWEPEIENDITPTW